MELDGCLIAALAIFYSYVDPLCSLMGLYKNTSIAHCSKSSNQVIVFTNISPSMWVCVSVLVSVYLCVCKYVCYGC